MISRKPAKTYLLALAALFAAQPALATSLRIAEYNIDASDQGNNNNISGASAGIPAILQAIGQHHIGTNAQPLDVIAFTELLDTSNTKTSTSLPLIVTALNNIYGAGTYAFVNTPDPTSGSNGQFNGPSGLVYNTHTVQAPTAIALGYSGNTSTNIPRAPMRYQITPLGYGSNATFYMYVSHYKADSGTGNQTTRNQEATEIRANADALGPNAHIIYTGDFNLAGGATEPAYATLTAAGNGRAYDATSPSTFISNFTGNSTTYKYLYSEASDSLDARFDMQLVSNAILNQPGLQLATDLADPYDPNNFPSAKYPYALEVFGNNGSTALGAATNLGTNTSLSDLPNASTILNDMMQPSGSDHLPIVADYNLVGVAPPTVSWLTAAGGTWQTQNNWQFSGIPDATSDTSFNLSANYTVTATGHMSVKSLSFNAGNVTFSLSGQTVTDAGALTLGATSPATLTLSPNSNVTVAGATTINAGSLLTLNGGTLTTASLSTGNTASRFNWASGTLSITGAGGLTISPTGPLGSGAATHGVLLVSNTLSIAASSSLALNGDTRVGALSLGGTLDLTTSKLTVEDTSANRSTDLQTLHNEVAGGSLFSSTAQTANATAGRTVYAVAVVDNGIADLTAFGGAGNVDANSILITATYNGDANLDGVVDLKDLQILAAHWQQPTSDWSQSDFDGNGIVDLADLQALATNWQAGIGGGGGSGDVAFNDALLSAFNAPAAVPEPASILFLLSAVPLFIRRRRRVHVAGNRA